MSIRTSTPINSPAVSSDETLLVPSRLLGALTVRRADVVSVVGGLYGFERCAAYALVPAGRDGLWWLQSTERAELVFLLADPFVFFPGHEVDVPPSELAHLGASASTTLVALVIITLPTGTADSPTANLRAPVILDAERRVARQVVLQDESISLTASLTI
jgi:flagellar assembly factor FliW